MSTQVRYLINEQGERVGVLLDLDAYNRLTNSLALEGECLSGLSQPALAVLAESMLAPAAQALLDELLALHTQIQLSADEITKIDRLLAQV